MRLNDTWYVPGRIMVIVFYCLSLSIGTYGQTLPSKAHILEKMKLANDYFITNRNHDPCTNCLGNRPSNIWTRSVYYEGALAYFSVSQDSAALAHTVSWASYHSWNMRGGTTTTNADDQCAGQCFIDLYQLDNQPDRVKNIKACIDRMLQNTSNNYWTWIDAIQMAMPVFAKLGVLNNDNKYFDKMYSLFNYPKTTLGLYNKKDSLWWRDASFKSAQSPSGKNIYWSRGNGWVFAALVRVLNEIPPSDTHREEYKTILREMAGALKKVQRNDGFWNENLADPDHFGGPEVSGTGLFTYGIAWGINNGLLNADDFMPTVRNAWNAIADSAIFLNGKLGYVQGTGDSPGDNGAGITNVTPSRTITPDFDDYGLGCVLLAGSEVAKLADKGLTEVVRHQTRNSTKPGVYPTLGNHLIQKKLPGTLPGSFTVYDLTGRVVVRYRVEGDSFNRSPLFTLPENVYLVKPDGNQ